MKSIYTILIVLLGCFQINAQIEEGSRSMSQGSNNSLSLDIPDADTKLAKKVWSKYLKKVTKKGKTKNNRKLNEVFTDDTELTAIGGANTVDIYAKFNDVGDNVNVVVWFDLGGAFLNSEMHGDKYTEGEKFLMKFALEVVITKTEAELKEEEKEQKSLENKLKGLKKDRERYLATIEEAKRKIAEAEANIEQNIKDQEVTSDEIETQKGVVKSVKDRLEELKY